MTKGFNIKEWQDKNLNEATFGTVAHAETMSDDQSLTSWIKNLQAAIKKNKWRSAKEAAKAIDMLLDDFKP